MGKWKNHLVNKARPHDVIMKPEPQLAEMQICWDLSNIERWTSLLKLKVHFWQFPEKDRPSASFFLGGSILISQRNRYGWEKRWTIIIITMPKKALLPGCSQWTPNERVTIYFESKLEPRRIRSINPAEHQRTHQDQKKHVVTPDKLLQKVVFKDWKFYHLLSLPSVLVFLYVFVHVRVCNTPSNLVDCQLKLPQWRSRFHPAHRSLERNWKFL